MNKPDGVLTTTGQRRAGSLILPAVLTLLMLPVLLGLGVWQLERRAWKHQILAAVERSVSGPPIPLQQSPPDFARVIVEGRFRPGVFALYGTNVRSLGADATLGADEVAVLERPDQPPVLVDMGWVPEHVAPPALPAGTVRIIGYVRPPERASFFGPTENPVTRRFFALDPAVIGPALGVAGILPFTVVRLGEAGETTPPLPATELPQPPDNHLQYAITWFSFAVTLLIVFAVHTRATLRARKEVP